MRTKVVKDSGEGVDYLKKLLYSVVDAKTVLFLSGGKTPRDAYSQLALEQKINPGAVAMVDERVGVKNHPVSNERMIKETGLLSYFKKKKIPFYPILRLHPKGVGSNYNSKVKYLLKHFSKSVGILGVGEDGHTAGIPARTQNSKLKTQNYVERVDDFPGEFKKRITLTFQALSQMDLLIVLVLGENKKLALQKIFKKRSLSEIPARFFVKKDISPKTILITDQKI